MKKTPERKFLFEKRLFLPIVCFLPILISTSLSCLSSSPPQDQTAIPRQLQNDYHAGRPLLTGAEQTEKYIPMLEGKRVGIVVNQTSRVGQVHLLDTLLKRNISVIKVFAPEHGFRGAADDGATIEDGVDPKTGISIVSLYGKKKEPSQEDMVDLDLLIFDIQDVGTRFYTFISTMHYIMDACSKYEKPLIILDRPNPNIHLVDGPILQESFKSFVGMHPIPVAHGMTVGELARMITGEKWLANDHILQLTIIPCAHYTRDDAYTLPLNPSPNLRTAKAIAWYPSLCFFEGTIVSVGRGTDKPFEQLGHPDFTGGIDSFIPQSSFGATSPKLENQTCYGFDLSDVPLDSIKSDAIDLSWLLHFYNDLKGKESFFLSSGYFDKLAGTDSLRIQIEAGWTAPAIKATWKRGLDDFMEKRAPYLLYP